jgi:hypothetical protein
MSSRLAAAAGAAKGFEAGKDAEREQELIKEKLGLEKREVTRKEKKTESDIGYSSALIEGINDNIESSKVTRQFNEKKFELFKKTFDIEVAIKSFQAKSMLYEMAMKDQSLSLNERKMAVDELLAEIQQYMAFTGRQNVYLDLFGTALTSKSLVAAAEAPFKIEMLRTGTPQVLAQVSKATEGITNEDEKKTAYPEFMKIFFGAFYDQIEISAQKLSVGSDPGDVIDELMSNPEIQKLMEKYGVSEFNDDMLGALPSPSGKNLFSKGKSVAASNWEMQLAKEKAFNTGIIMYANRNSVLLDEDLLSTLPEGITENPRVDDEVMYGAAVLKSVIDSRIGSIADAKKAGFIKEEFNKFAFQYDVGLTENKGVIVAISDYLSDAYAHILGPASEYGGLDQEYRRAKRGQ